MNKGTEMGLRADDVMEKSGAEFLFRVICHMVQKTKLQLLLLLDPDMTSSIMFKHTL